MQLRQFIRGRSVALASVGVLALGAAATGTADASTAHHAAAHTASKTPYVIGSLTSLTGDFGTTDGGGAYGVKAWASYVNSHGGINGHPVKLTVKDDQGSPSVALSEIKGFAAQKNVIALVGNVSSVEASWAPIAQAEKLPVVGDFPFTPASYTTKYVYPQGTTFPSILYGEVYSAVKLAHDKKIAFFYCAEESACSLSVPAIKAYATADGGTLVNSQAVSATAPNYDAVCTAAKQAGAQALVLALGDTTIVSLAQSCSSSGYTPEYVMQTTAVAPLETTVPGLKNSSYGVLETFPWTATSTPAQKTFQAAVKAAKVPANEYGAALSLGYTGGALFQAAASTVKGTLTRASLATALWKLPKGDTLGRLGAAVDLQGQRAVATAEVLLHHEADGR